MKGLISQSIKLVLFDVDGVMTDGSIYMSDTGEAFKKFNAKDGLAIELLRVHGIKAGIISGKSSRSLAKRCEQLGFDVVEFGCKNKLPRLLNICSQLGFDASEVAFCGDDVLDIPAMEACGFSGAPSDSHDLTLKVADWTSYLKGGDGFVRDFVDNLLVYQLQLPLDEIYIPLMEKISSDDVSGVEQ